MPSQHKHPPISLRLPGADRSWLFAYAQRTGQPVNRVLTEALKAYRKEMEDMRPGKP
jgi:predicted DNA-binding protein